jgi:hypothetical protein
MRTRFIVLVLVVGTAYWFNRAGSADPKPKKDAPEPKDPIQLAIKKGADYLIDLHRPAPNYNGGSNGMGSACLAGLALVESGVPETNASLRNITQFVRERCLRETGTYQISLCIMFLDQLGNPADRVFIQFLGHRLMSGQTPGGGWSYQCNGYSLNAQAEDYLRRAFVSEYRLHGKPISKGTTTTAPPKKDEVRPDLKFDTDEPKSVGPKEGVRTDIEVATKDPPPPKIVPPKKVVPKSDLPPLLPAVRTVVNALKANMPGGNLGGRAVGLGMDGDNSNTQFAALGLWCARKHGVDVTAAAKRLDERFRASQSTDGGWTYVGNTGSTPTMTCAGLIALAVTYGATESALRSSTSIKHAAPHKGDHVDIGEDKVITAGLNRLGGYLTQFPNLPGAANGLTGNLYFLWSLERVGVIYGLTTIGKVDWYEFGADSLVSSQAANGSWAGGYGADVCTPFALLFLSRANVARDLAASLQGKVKDPGVTRLQSANFNKPEAKAPALNTPGDTIDPHVEGDNPAPKPVVPATNPADDFDTQAARLTNGLLHASGQQRDEMIATLRDTKGSVYTEALARAAGQLKDTARTQARNALDNRLTRMTAGTLKEMLEDDNPEVRRSSAAACGSKEEKQLIPQLITCLSDKQSMVVRAAHESLKSLSGKDFGPNDETDGAQKAQAILAWRSWWNMQQR